MHVILYEIVRNNNDKTVLSLRNLFYSLTVFEDWDWQTLLEKVKILNILGYVGQKTKSRVLRRCVDKRERNFHRHFIHEVKKHIFEH